MLLKMCPFFHLINSFLKMCVCSFFLCPKKWEALHLARRKTLKMRGLRCERKKNLIFLEPKWRFLFLKKVFCIGF